jgi:cellulose synthase/poly-beta-1,6-N-acetylglucosamine synthase-like glycosyltransferase
MLAPYYAVLAVLSMYGLHRYFVIREYYRGKHKLNQPPAARFETLPPVTIQLPLYNEEFVVERLLETTVEMRYPRELLQIQVLDDSTDDSQPRNAALCARFRALGHDVEYIHRVNRSGFKAGALENGLKTAKGEFVAVFDADFLPPADFVEKTIHYFTDPGVGVVQTRWSHINRDSNLLTEVQAMLLDAHFVLEHAARFTSGHFFNFNGTAGILRKSMIADAGGWQHDTLTEDTDLSYRAQLKGWRFVYLPSMACPSELPVETHAFQVQQQRWSKGLTQCARKLWAMVRRADLPRGVKVEAFFHLTPNISYPLMIVVSALMMPAMIIRFHQGPLEMMLIDAPLILANFVSIGAFYLVAQRELYPASWKRSIAFVPALMAAGVMLTLSNTKSVLEALFGLQSAFVRTPKYAVAQGQAKVKQQKYRRRSGWLPFLELAAGSFFLFMAAWAIESVNYLSVPFILLFVAGYYWAGFSTLWQEWQGKLRFERAREATEAAIASADAGR